MATYNEKNTTQSIIDTTAAGTASSLGTNKRIAVIDSGTIQSTVQDESETLLRIVRSKQYFRDKVTVGQNNIAPQPEILYAEGE